MRLKEKLIKELEVIKGLEQGPSKVAGGIALFYKNKEIAHFHHDHEIDLRLTKKIIKLEGLNHFDDSDFHHHRSKTSEWIELRFKKTADIESIVRLFELAIKQY